MPKNIDKNPDKHSDKPRKAKDPAKPTRAKAARPDMPAMGRELADLLNPAIGRGEAGIGSQTGLGTDSDRSKRDRTAQERHPAPALPIAERAKDSATGLQPPPDNSRDRRADFANAHRARASTARGFEEKPQADYAAEAPVADFDPQLAEALRLEPDEDFVGSTGVAATAHALETLLREGRAEFRDRPWTPHRPPRPEKTEGGQRLVIKSDFEPKGDQPQAIEELVAGVERNERAQVLLGVTGSGKTFTMAKVIERTQRPALILAPNKTLAAQLYGEFRSFFPDNAVEYFVSYYDYYQPEAYVPRTDTYIEKESSINDQIDRMRHSATRALLERDDV